MFPRLARRHLLGSGASSGKTNKTKGSKMFLPFARAVRQIVQASLLTVAASSLGALSLTRIDIPWASPVGIGYQPNSQNLIVSVNHPGNAPFYFGSISANGTLVQFSTATGTGQGANEEEAKIAVVRTTLGGFTQGEVFAPNGFQGGILRVSPDGQAVDTEWALLKDVNGIVEPGWILSLHVDTTGEFNNQLIAVTTQGGVWRINSSGSPTLITRIMNGSFSVALEGVLTIPVDATKYGPWSGKIIVGAEDEDPPFVYAVTPAGVISSNQMLHPVTSVPIGPEDFDLAASGEDFYIVNFSDGPSRGLFRAPASDFSAKPGAVIMTSEGDAAIYRITWVNNAFVVEALGTKPGAHFEHATFAPITVVSPLPTVKVRVSDPLASETDSGDQAIIVMERTGNTDAALTVTVQLSGSAVNGTDYTHSGMQSATTVVFAEEEQTKEILITASSDASNDPNETVTLSVQSNPSLYTIGSPSSATINIGDSGSVNSVAVMAQDAIAVEGGSDKGTFVIHRAGNLSGTRTVNFTPSGIAGRGTTLDYTLQDDTFTDFTGTSVFFPAFVSQVNVHVNANADAFNETSETAILQIVSGTDYSAGSVSSDTVTIHDPPTVNVTAIDSTAAEAFV